MSSQDAHFLNQNFNINVFMTFLEFKTCYLSTNLKKSSKRDTEAIVCTNWTTKF